MKKIFLDNLPRWENNTACSGKIKWRECLGYKVFFNYDDIKGWIEIINYCASSKKLTVQYNNNKVDIYYGHFLNCHLGNLLNKKTSNFKIEIGTRLNDNNRDITIIDRKIITHYKEDGSYKSRNKYYKYKCNKCGFSSGLHYNIREKQYKQELWTLESNLLNGSNCSCCSNVPKIIVNGINDIPTTAPELINFFQGGMKKQRNLQ